MAWMRSMSVLLALAALGTAGSAAHASEARVTFALNAGWVDVSVRHDGKPVGSAHIQILDERGVKFAEGETGAGGETAFPMPPGAYCIVEIKTGDKTADPIRLLKTERGVEPARVLLSYGLRPCCRSALIKPEPVIVGYPEEPPPEAHWSDQVWQTLVPVGVVALIAGALVLVQVWWFRRRWRSAQQTREES